MNKYKVKHIRRNYNFCSTVSLELKISVGAQELKHNFFIIFIFNRLTENHLLIVCFSNKVKI